MLITFVTRCAETFALTGTWGFQWAGIASDPVVDGFSGGAQIGYNYQFTPGSGVVIGIEACNSRDYPMLLIGDVTDACAIARAVDSPAVRIVFDIFHVQARGGGRALSIGRGVPKGSRGDGLGECSDARQERAVAALAGCGDPAPGVRKQLTVVYQQDGVVVTASAWEGEARSCVHGGALAGCGCAVAPRTRQRAARCLDLL